MKTNDGEDISNLFFKKKPVGILIAIRQKDENYALQISRDVDVTYSHTVKVLNKMNEFGLVKFERKSRKKIVRLTEDGEKVAEHLHKARNEMEKKARKTAP
jgi:DNA-binding MarR family transcriptional regulator